MRGYLDEDKPKQKNVFDGDGVAFDDVVCVGQTEKAIRVRIAGKEHWLPQAAVHDDSEVYAKDHEGKLVIKGWWARKNTIAHWGPESSR